MASTPVDAASLFNELKARLSKLHKEGAQFANACTKPNGREFLRLAWIIGMSCFILGASRRPPRPRARSHGLTSISGSVGAVIELLFIPINRVITGETVVNRALYR